MSSNSRWLVSVLFVVVGLAANAATAEPAVDAEPRMTRHLSVDVPMKKADSGMDGDLAHYTRPHDFKTIKRSYKVHETGGPSKHASARKPAPPPHKP